MVGGKSIAYYTTGEYLLNGLYVGVNFVRQGTYDYMNTPSKSSKNII
jgi:hypothetical protein